MDIFRSALSLVIYKNGSVTEADVDDLIDRYRKKQSIVIEKDSFLQTLRTATEHYEGQTRCLFVCAEGPCLQKQFMEPCEAAVQELSKELGCDVEVTGCHWQCELAPVSTLKVGSTIKVLAKSTAESVCANVRTALALAES